MMRSFVKASIFMSFLLSLVGLIYITFASPLRTSWIESHSPAKGWTLIVSYRSPIVLRGTHTVYIYSKQAGKWWKQKLFETKLENEGSGLAKRNYQLAWEGEIAILTLKGHDQPDTTYRIDPNSSPPYELLPYTP